MRDCRRITYENALLGDAMIEKLNNASSQLTADNEKALKISNPALRLREERDSRGRRKKCSRRSTAIENRRRIGRETCKGKAIEDEAQRVLDELKQKEMEKERLDEENKRILAEQERLAKEKDEAESQFSNLTEEAATLEEKRILAEERGRKAKKAQEEEEEVRKRIEEMLKNKSSIEHQLEKERVKRKKAEVN